MRKNSKLWTRYEYENIELFLDSQLYSLITILFYDSAFYEIYGFILCSLLLVSSYNTHSFKVKHDVHDDSIR